MQASAPKHPELDAHLLDRRLEAFAQSSPLTLLPIAASIVVLVFVHSGVTAPATVAAWICGATLILAARLLLARSILPLDPTLAKRRRQWRTVNAVLALGSLAWAISLPMITWMSPAPGIAVVTIIGTALLCAVLPLYGTAPGAAAFHVLALAVGLGAAQWFAFDRASWPALVLIAVYAITLLFAIGWRNRQFRAACVIELERRDSERTIRALLNEHEAQGADWLWALDAEGALSGVSPQLGTVLQVAPDMLEGTDFLSVMESGAERDRLAALIAARSDFRDEPVRVIVAGVTRNWRLSGHPQPGGGMAGVGRDTTEQPGVEERVRAMAHVDPLTGLANRHFFTERLRQLLSADAEARDVPGRPLALLYLDLDDFKSVNDVHGHVFGDSLLREIAARLRRESRAGDLVARLGGDEFAILIEASAGDGMLIERAHRLLAAVREPVTIMGQAARLSTSIGIARPSATRDPAELMRRVDLALYAAKAKGRDQMALFDETLDHRARERRALEVELRDVVERNQLVLHYQPIIALQSGVTVGYEALLRWRHPERGLLPPAQFLPIAEEAGLLIGLGDWVIRTALADVASWPGAFRIAINLSPSQIRNPHLPATVNAALAASGVSPSRLELEITENVLLDDAEEGAAAIERLRSLGVAIALDDFGTGYSSLSYLRRFRFDRVKIDRVFVRDIDTSDEAQAIVSAITRLAQALGMNTTAEGVERPEQLDLLRKLGCDEAQGFLILEPVEAERIEESRSRGDDLPDAVQEIEGYRKARRAALTEVPGLIRRR